MASTETGENKAWELLAAADPGQVCERAGAFVTRYHSCRHRAGTGRRVRNGDGRWDVSWTATEVLGDWDLWTGDWILEQQGTRIAVTFSGEDGHKRTAVAGECNPAARTLSCSYRTAVGGLTTWEGRAENVDTLSGTSLATYDGKSARLAWTATLVRR